MTKEEARESLLGTKVYIGGVSAEVQKKLFSIGIIWFNGEEKVFEDAEFLLLNSESTIMKFHSVSHFRGFDCKEITAEHILSLKIDKSCNPMEFCPILSNIRCKTLSDKRFFKPFDKVLVRNYDYEDWSPALLSKVQHSDCGDIFWDMTGGYYKYCLHYEGNEHLANTI